MKACVVHALGLLLISFLSPCIDSAPIADSKWGELIEPPHKQMLEGAMESPEQPVGTLVNATHPDKTTPPTLVASPPGRAARLPP